MDLPPDAPTRAPSSGRVPRTTLSSRRASSQTPYYTSAPVRTPRAAESPRPAWRPAAPARVASRRMHSDVSILDIDSSAPDTSAGRLVPAASTPIGASRPRSARRREHDSQQQKKPSSLYDSIMSVIWPSKSRRRTHSAAFGHEEPARQAAADPPTLAPATRMPLASTPVPPRSDFTFTNGDTSAAEVSVSVGYGLGARLPYRSQWHGIDAQTLAEADAEEEHDTQVDQDTSLPAEANQSQSQSRESYRLLSEFFREKADEGGAQPLTKDEWAGIKNIVQQCYPGTMDEAASSVPGRVLPTPGPSAATSTANVTRAAPAPAVRAPLKTTRDPPTTRQARKMTIFTLPGQRRRATTAVRAMGARAPAARPGLFTPYRPPGVYGAAEPVAKRPRLREVEDDAPAPTPLSLLPSPAPESSAIPAPTFHPGSSAPAPKPKPAKPSLVASTLKDLLSENPLPEDKSAKDRAALTNPYATLAGKEDEDAKTQNEAAQRVERMLEKQKKLLKQRHEKKRLPPSTEKEGQSLLDLIQQTAQHANDDKAKRSETDKGAANESTSPQSSPTRRRSAHWASSIPRHPSPLKQAAAAADSSASLGDESSMSAASVSHSVAPPSPAFTFLPPVNLSDMQTKRKDAAPPPSVSLGTKMPESQAKPAFSFQPQASEPAQKPVFAGNKTADSAPKLGFSFQTSQSDEAPAKPRFSFQTPKASEPKPENEHPHSEPANSTDAPAVTFDTSQGAVPLSTQTRPDEPPTVPKHLFSFGAPSPVASEVTSAEDAGSSGPKGEVLQKSEPALPEFDFGLPPSPGLLASRSPAEQTAIKAALSMPADRLPLFRFNSSATTGPADNPHPAAPAGTSTESPASPAPASEDAAPGAGEEDEVTLSEARVKATAFSQGEWHNVGVGLFRIKQQTDTRKTRALMRSEGNGNVLINFALWPEFTLQQEKLFLNFLGFNQEGTPTKYRLRVKTSEEAETLASALLEGCKSGELAAKGTVAAPATPPVSTPAAASPMASADGASGSATTTEADGTNDDEDTGVVVEVRTKAYKRAQNGEWQQVGVGRMKVTVLESGQARLLLRSEPANHVLINFRLYKGLNPKFDGKLVSLLGFDGKEPTPYRARVLTPADGEKLVKAIRDHTPAE